MLRTVVLILVAFLGLVAVAPEVALGQPRKGSNDPPSKSSASRVDEPLFLFYALEDMSRRLPTESKEGGRPSGPPTVALSRFLAQRKRHFDTVRRYAAKKNQNEEFLAVFQSYEKELDLLDEYKNSLEKSCAEANKKLAVANAEAASRVMLTGLGYALRSVAEGDDDEKSFVRSMSGMMSSYIDEQKKISEVRGLAAQELLGALTAADREFAPRWEERHDDFHKRLKAFIEANKWQDAEFAFQVAGKKTVASRNPFLIIEQSRAILTDKDATVPAMLEQAEKCRAASKMVPADHVFDVYRAAFLSVGGLIANRAAAKDIGTTGFPVTKKDVPEAGKLAHAIWSAYVQLEPYDTNFTDDVVQAVILACAYGGDIADAFKVVIAVAADQQAARVGRNQLRLTASSRPDFWYDCARVCSVAGNTPFALECLKQALKLGYSDKEAAKVDADLRNLREDRRTADQLKRLLP